MADAGEGPAKRVAAPPRPGELERAVAREVSMGGRLFDLWLERGRHDFPTPSTMFEAMVRAWREGGRRPPILDGELEEARAESERLSDALERQRRRNEDADRLGMLVLLEKTATGRAFSADELGQLWKAIREDRLVADEQGGFGVEGTDLHVLGPAPVEFSLEPPVPLASTRTETEGDRLVEEAVDRAFREALEHAAREAFQKLLASAPSAEEQKAAIVRMLEEKFRPTKEGIARLQEDIARLRAQREEFRQKLESLRKEHPPL